MPERAKIIKKFLKIMASTELVRKFHPVKLATLIHLAVALDCVEENLDCYCDCCLSGYFHYYLKALREWK